MQKRTLLIGYRRKSLWLFLLSLQLFVHPPLEAGCIVGQLIDVATTQPVNWGTIKIVEVDQVERSHHGGKFQFCNLHAGDYTVEIQALGYRSQRIHVHVAAERDTVQQVVQLKEAILLKEEVVIVAQKDDSFTGIDPSRVLSGSRLQQQLEGTLAATIASEPGVSEQSMGSATARPVVRGMGGDRLVILEDGMETGDASNLSTDHAVTADPLTTTRIEILRGPASYLYSSNALGGVMNVNRERSLANLPDQIHGNITLQANSVSTGAAGGTSLRMPVGPLALFLHGSYRRANDVSTPNERVENTDLETIDLSVGSRYPFRDGSIGIEGGYYRNHYGLPGGFTGAHPNGVRIEMDRHQYTADTELFLRSPFFRSIKLDGSYVRYHHREIESGGVIGTEYGILTSTGSISLHHDAIQGLIDHGVLRLHGSFIDFAANGVQIPQTDERHLAFTLFEEKQTKHVNLSGALRFDYHQVLPAKTDTLDVGIISDRQFSGFSGGVSGSYSPNHLLSFGLTLSRTWRKPNIQELFSNGPHLAAYSYEIGNTNLEPETGFGIELSSSMRTEQGFLSASLFRNTMRNYIVPQATGDTNLQTFLPIYQHVGKLATLTGAEIEVELSLIDGLTGVGTLAWVVGTDRETHLPLSWIPPLNGEIELRHQINSIFSGITTRWASSQNRVGEFEEPTSGYFLFDLSGDYDSILKQHFTQS